VDSLLIIIQTAKWNVQSCYVSKSFNETTKTYDEGNFTWKWDAGYLIRNQNVWWKENYRSHMINVIYYYLMFVIRKYWIHTRHTRYIHSCCSIKKKLKSRLIHSAIKFEPNLITINRNFYIKLKLEYGYYSITY
jgi:hypothetical protein